MSDARRADQPGDRLDPGDQLDVNALAERWAQTWAVAWPSRDAEAIVALQAPDGCHWSSPLAAPHCGRDGLRAYLLGSFGHETEPTRCVFAAPIVHGRLAAVEYWAHVAYDGARATISGCTVLEFDEAGLVSRSRDYSFFEPGYLRNMQLPSTGLGRSPDAAE